MGKKNKNKPAEGQNTGSGQPQQGGQPQGQQPQQAGPSGSQQQQQQQQQQKKKKDQGAKGGPGGDTSQSQQHGKDKQKDQGAKGGPGGDTSQSQQHGKDKQKVTGGPGGDTASQGQQQEFRGKQGKQGPGGRDEPRQRKAAGPERSDPQQQRPVGFGRGEPQQQQGAWVQQHVPGGFGRGEPSQQGGRGEPRQQGAWGEPRQQGGRGESPQHGGRGESQQQGGRGEPRQQGGRGEREPRQQGAWGEPRQQGGRGESPQHTGRGESQQQGGRGEPRQQGGRGEPRQQGGRGEPRQQGGRGEPRQQGAWGEPRQQGGRGESPQHGGRSEPRQQGGRGEPQQQGAWGEPRQQGGRGEPRQQGAWGEPRQQGGRGESPQHGGRSEPRQQGGRGEPQQQGAWGEPRQQGGRGEPRQQGAWGEPRQQGGRGEPRQQGAWGEPRQQGGRGEPRQQQGDRGQQQVQAGSSRGDGPRQQREQRSQESSKPDDSISKKFAQLALRPYSPPRDIPLDKGTRGRLVKIEANYLEIDIKNMIDKAYHYDISFDPPRPKKYLRPAFNNFCQRYFPKIRMAFDGQANVYSPVQLNTQDLVTQDVIVIEPDGREKAFKVTLKETLAPLIEMSSLKTYNKTRIFDKPMRALQCLDVALSSPIVNSNIAVKAGRVYYVKPPNPPDLQSGHELWLGLFQSAILGDRPFLNIDVGHKAFPKDSSVIDVIRGMYNANIGSQLDYRTINDLYDHLKGLEIVYSPPKCFNATQKHYKFLDIKGECNKETFKDESGCVQTIAEYFAKKGYRLQYPHLPCLHVGPKTKNIYLPVELCYVPGGQATNKKANEIIVRNIIRYAATPTTVRKQKIMDLFNKFNYKDDLIMKEFKVSIKNDFLILDARILNPPKIEYADLKCIQPAKGSWEMRSEKYLVPVKKIEWAILNTDFKVDDYTCRNFCDMVLRTSRELNMEMSPKYDVIKEKDTRYLDKQLSSLKHKDLVFVVLSNQKSSYANIKKTAEIKLGILTQCIKPRTIGGPPNNVNSVVRNILLKVNAKLNGVNHKINAPCATPIMSQNVMFIGADVTHPAPGESKPSVVGVASSFDPSGFQYCMRWRLQDSKQEIISDMENIMKEQLNFYKKQRGKLPDKIIYYRDGVSEGQFEDVRKVELSSMDKACAGVQANYKPDITCLVVQKRHHTRFFPPDRSNVANDDPKNKNVPAGTVVDSVITHPAESQFFLVSHRSLQGVAKPAKYCILRDNSKFNIDDLQALTFNLCHMFSRCNRSVSYAAPAYYAHLAAYRGRVYIEDSRFFDNLEKVYKGLRIQDNILINRPMFFV